MATITTEKQYTSQCRIFFSHHNDWNAYTAMIHLENKKNQLDLQLKRFFFFFLNATAKERDIAETATTILQNLKSAR